MGLSQPAQSSTICPMEASGSVPSLVRYVEDLATSFAVDRVRVVPLQPAGWTREADLFGSEQSEPSGSVGSLLGNGADVGAIDADIGQITIGHR
jgi:hypothetical protein